MGTGGCSGIWGLAPAPAGWRCRQLGGSISTNWVMPVPGPRPLPGLLWSTGLTSNLLVPGLLHRRLVHSLHRRRLPPPMTTRLIISKPDFIALSKLWDLWGAGGSPKNTVGRGYGVVNLGKFVWPWADNIIDSLWLWWHLISWLTDTLLFSFSNSISITNVVEKIF